MTKFATFSKREVGNCIFSSFDGKIISLQNSNSDRKHGRPITELLSNVPDRRWKVEIYLKCTNNFTERPLGAKENYRGLSCDAPLTVNHT